MKLAEGEKDFRAICDAPSVAAAVAALDDPHLAKLLRHLKSSTSGIRFLVLGALQIEASNRFIKAIFR